MYSQYGDTSVVASCLFLWLDLSRGLSLLTNSFAFGGFTINLTKCCCMEICLQKDCVCSASFCIFLLAHGGYLRFYH